MSISPTGSAARQQAYRDVECCRKGLVAIVAVVAIAMASIAGYCEATTCQSSRNYCTYRILSQSIGAGAVTVFAGMIIGIVVDEIYRGY